MYWPQQDITSSPTTVLDTDRVFWCDATTGDQVLNLPSVTGKAALYFVFKKIDATTHTVTINPPAGKTIDGMSSYVLTAQNQIIGVTADTHGNYKLVDGNSSGTAVGRGTRVNEKTDGTTGAGSLAAVAGMTEVVELSVAGTVIVSVSGSWHYTGQPTAAVIGMEIDGTQYYWTVNNSLVGAGSDNFQDAAGSHTMGIFLNAGSHTIKFLAAATNMYLNGSPETPASLVITYPTVTTFGGGSPTSDPTHDLSGVWSDTLVVGLQGDPLPTKVARKYLRRNDANSGWELSDPTFAVFKNSSLVGIHRRINILDATNIITYVTEDITNDWVNIKIESSGGGGGGSDDPLGKAFFVHNGLMPANTFKEELYDYPATDFANLNGGTKSVSMSRARFTPGGSNVANWGWDIGSSKSQILFIMGMMRGRQNQTSMFITNTLPAAAQIEDAYNFDLEPGVPDIALLKRASGSWSGLGSEAKLVPTNSDAGMSFGMALYYDDTTNHLICFLRLGGEWFPIIDTTDSTFTTMRYCGIFNDSSTGAGSVVWSGVPMAIYTD